MHSRNDEAQPLPFLSPVPREGVRIWMRAADGAATLLDTACVPLYDVSGRWTGARGVCRDITAQWNRDRTLAKVLRRERLVNGLIDSIRDATDHDELLGHAAKATGEALGARTCVIYRPGDAAAMTVVARQGEAPDEALAGSLGEAVKRLCDDTRVTALTLGGDEVMIVVTRHRRGVNGALLVARAFGDEPWCEEDHGLMASVAGQLGVAIEQIAIHESLIHQSLTDELTGLNNCRAFMETLRGRFGQAMRSGRTGALLYLDLDNFKQVNDVHGHQRGDEALKTFAAILARQTRVNDVVARLGGDEFGLWLDEVGKTTRSPRRWNCSRRAPSWRTFRAIPMISSACRSESPRLIRSRVKPWSSSSPAPIKPCTRPRRPARQAARWRRRPARWRDRRMTSDRTA